MSAPPVGSILGERYVLLARVTEAPGYVEFRARDRELEIEIAVWWLEPALFGDPARREALLGVGVELRNVRDAALRGCLGVSRGTGGLWATWQLATGPGPFGVASGREPPPLDDVRRWSDAACAGVAALHREGLVHGRLSAVDVVSIGGVLKLGGGGLWRDVDPTAAQTIWAAQAYALAPELRAGHAPTEAADVWSIAAIALERIAGVPGGVPECARAAARRHPSLAALLVGAMSPDPGRRPAPSELAEAVRNATAQPYAPQDARGKPVQQGGAGATIQGHASPSADTPRRTAARPAVSGPTDTRPGVAPAPGAFSPEPMSFALPTPVAAPRAPRPTRPAVDVQAPRRGTIPPPTPPRKTGTTAPPPVAVLPTPARTAIAGAIDRARTAPPGEFRVAAVSMKPGGAQERTGPQPIIGPDGLPDQPTGETPHLIKPRIRGIAESAPGGRAFSVAPGQLGFLAPPKAVSDRHDQARRRWVLVIVVLIALAIGGGVTIGLLL